MHKVDEVREAYAHAARTYGKDHPLCLMMTRAYVPYVRPYIHNARVLEQLDDLPHGTDDVVVCVYAQAAGSMEGEVNVIPCDHRNIEAAVIATAMLFKMQMQPTLAIIVLDDKGPLETLFKEMHTIIEAARLIWDERPHDKLH